jgi:hypothetical protein
MTELTPHEINLARKRIMRWPRQDRVDLTDLTEPEVELVMLAVALLDMRTEKPE